MQPLNTVQLERLAIFPLPGVVLFPSATVPLHVFEPRYVELVEHCLAEEAPLAVWQVNGRLASTPFGPALAPVATVGHIVEHVRLTDGRLDVLVRGLQRVQLVGETASGRAFRTVAARAHPTEPLTLAEAAPQLATLRALSHSLTRTCPEAASLLQEVLVRHPEPAELSDALCSISDDDGRTRQRLLELSSVSARFEHVIDTLATLALVAANATEPPVEPS